MSDNFLYVIVAISVSVAVYFALGMFRSNTEEIDAEMEEVKDLSRQCVKEAQETNRLLKEIKELMEKK